MRLKAFFFCALFLLLAGLSGSSPDLGLYVERLSDPSAIRCPICGRPIVAGKIHENAEDVMATEMGGALSEKGIIYTRQEGVERHLHVFIYRFQEREGGNFSVVRPASVGFHVHLYEGDKLIDTYAFDETQQPLSDNIFRFFTFLRRGAKWITAGELAREGIQKSVDALSADLQEPVPQAER
jgi:hypothetical protein